MRLLSRLARRHASKWLGGWWALVPLAVVSGALSLADCAHTTARQPKAVALQAAGAASLARGARDRAAGQFALALEYEPRLAEAENGLGLVALAYGDRGLAEHHFRAALAIDEDLAEAHLNLGGIRLAQHQLDDALECFRAALAIDPGYGAARLAAGETLLRLGRLEDARWELAKLCAAEPGNAAAHAAQALVQAQPTSAEDWLALGIVLAQQRRWIDACGVLERAALLGPRLAEVPFTQAFVELGRERPAAAVTAARHALELRVPYPQARLLLAEAQYRAGDAAAGRATLQRFVDEAPPEKAAEKARAQAVMEGGTPGL